MNRKQTDVEGVNDSAQNSAHQFEDKLKTENQLINELLLHRTENRHLDETLKTTVIELDNEKQKSRGLERQLQENQNVSVDLLKQIDELRKELRLIDESKKNFEALLMDRG